MNYNFIYDSERGKLFFVRPDETLMEITETANVEQEFIEVYQAINNLREETTSKEQFYSAFPTQTASGAIVSITDGADDIPLKSCVVTMLPIQDLHGQDAPYPAGGGKNLCPMVLDDIKALNPYGTWDGNKYTFRNMVWTIEQDAAGNCIGITANGTATQEVSLTFTNAFDIDGNYILSGCPSDGNGTTTYNVRILTSNNSSVVASDYGSGATFTATNTVRVRITIYGGYTANGLKFFPMIRPASVSDATFAPYSNICPISGHDDGTVWGAGRNLLNPDWSAYSQTRSYTYLNDVVPIGQVARMTVVDKDTSVQLNGASIGFCYERLADGVTVNEHRWVISSQGLQSNTSNISGHGVICSNVLIYPNTKEAFDTLFARYYIMVELGTDAHDFAPYTSASYHSDFPSTVYGGDWAVTEGEIASQWAIVDLGTLNWAYRPSEQAYPYFECQTLSDRKVGSTALICSAYKTASGGRNTMTSDCMISTYNTMNSITICIRDDSYTDPAVFKEALSGVMLCYELAQPQSLSVDPHTIPSQLGDNNVWSDAGNVSVTYRADIQKYIDNAVDGASVPDSDSEDEAVPEEEEEEEEAIPEEEIAGEEDNES